RRPGTRAAEPVAATRAGDKQRPPGDSGPGDAEAGHSLPDDSWPDDSWPDDPTPGDATATDPKLGAAARGASETPPTARMAKPRRRVGFRKGADLDEELWPTETFGGVSDEQFWDDLASDKPLATTARTAQQEPPSRNRLSGAAPGAGLLTGAAADPTPGLDTGAAAGPQTVQAPAVDRKRDERGPGGGRRGRYPAPRTASDPTAERTAIQPSYAATQPVQGMKPPLPAPTQPVRAAATPPRGIAAQPREAATPPRGTAAQPREAATPPRGTAAQPRGAGTQPTETRRRRPISTEEDPRTSAPFSLRPSGPVDGRSSLRARNDSADRFDTGTSPYPYSTPSYGNGSPAAPAAEPRRRNGKGSHARPEDPGDGTRPARQAYPRGSHQATGSYRSNGSYPGSSYPGSSYPGSGYPGNGHQ